MKDALGTDHVRIRRLYLPIRPKVWFSPGRKTHFPLTPSAGHTGGVLTCLTVTSLMLPLTLIYRFVKIGMFHNN